MNRRPPGVRPPRPRRGWPGRDPRVQREQTAPCATPAQVSGASPFQPCRGRADGGSANRGLPSARRRRYCSDSCSRRWHVRPPRVRGLRHAGECPVVVWPYAPRRHQVRTSDGSGPSPSSPAGPVDREARCTGTGTHRPRENESRQAAGTSGCGRPGLTERPSGILPQVDGRRADGNPSAAGAGALVKVGTVFALSLAGPG